MLLSPAHSRSFFTTTHKLEIVRRCFTLVFPSFLQKYSGHVEQHSQPEARKCWRCLRSDLCFVLPVSSCHITSHRTTGCFKALFLISLNEAPTQYQSHCICSSLLFFLHTLFSFCCLGSWLLSQFPIAPVTCLSALLINLPVSLCFSLKRKKEAGNSSCSYHKVSHLSVLTV